MESAAELLVSRAQAPCPRGTEQSARDRCVLKFHVKKKLEINVYGIEIAVSMLDGPNLSEHRHRELALVRLMGRAIDVILNTGENNLDIRIETAKAMIREFQTVYPETSEIQSPLENPGVGHNSEHESGHRRFDHRPKSRA